MNSLVPYDRQKRQKKLPLLWIEHSTSRNRLLGGTRSELQSGALPGELKRLDSCDLCRCQDTSSFEEDLTISTRASTAYSSIIHAEQPTETAVLVRKSWLY